MFRLPLLGIFVFATHVHSKNENGFCVPHPEHLSVICRRTNITALPQLLQEESQAIKWVEKLKVFDSHIPILTVLSPKSSGVLSHLENLQMVRCHLRQVRVEAMIQIAGSLRHLSLAHNQLVAVPAAVSLLEKLETLDLRHNAITRISALLSRLPALQRLDLSHNRIRQFSGWGSSVSSPHLKRLTHLILSDNLIHEIWPSAISSLSSLQSLDLSENLIQRLPPTVLNGSNLLEFDLRGNPWYCSCESSWLTRFQYEDPDSQIQIQLPTCTSPHPLKDQPLEALIDDELCNATYVLNTTKKISNDVDDRHIRLADVGPRSFKIAWNVSNISTKNRKIQEYLGWRVTFRPFGEVKESEVLLITLAGADVRKKTGTTSGHYSVKNLTPDTSYLLCFQALTDGEINNIIESQRRTRKEYIHHPSEILNNAQDIRFWGRSLDGRRGQILANDVRGNSKTQANLRSSTTTEAQTTTSSTTTTEKSNEDIELTTQKYEPNNFVYTNTGERISLNFAPPHIPNVPPPPPPSLNRSPFPNQNLPNTQLPFLNSNRGFIPNVSPPLPPNFSNFASGPPGTFSRSKRSIAQPNIPGKGRCMEIKTDVEDELVMPVTVAAAASSSSTMIIFMICCCCFPKRCNKMRDCCVDKCKSGKKTIIKTGSKTKTFVRPPKKEKVEKQYQLNISASTPDLRLLNDNESDTKDYAYHKLNKYYTMRTKVPENQSINFYPGYDLPKLASAKYHGYDFPKISVENSTKPTHLDLNYGRRMSTDDNVSPVVKNRFMYYNINKVQANLDIPNKQCQYSDKIKGLNLSSSPKRNNLYENYHKLPPGPPRKVFDNEDEKVKELLRSPKIRARSRSEPDIIASISFKEKPKSDKAKTKIVSEIPEFRLEYKNIQTENNLARTTDNLVSDLRLETVRHYHQMEPKRPTILNISSDSNSFNSLPLPPRKVSKSPLPIGEVAVTGGTLVEVPEGYVLPSKPRPVNVLRLQVPG